MENKKMDKTKITTLFLIGTFSASVAFAKPMTCPPASMIRNVKFIEAIDYDRSIDLWEVLSVPFMYEGVQWNLAFGTEFPGVKSASEALEVANKTYKNYPILDKTPDAVPIPGHIFCDYTHEGMEYWIQALSPPGK